MAHIGISWHMGARDVATASAALDGSGHLCLHEGQPWAYPDLNIYMPSLSNARLAAAAINGELADELQALRDALANPPAFYEEADWRAWLDDLIAGVDDTLRRSGTEAPKPAKVTA